MKLIAITLFVLGACWVEACAQDPQLRWGEFGYYSNWDRYPYAIDSNYEFIGRLPDLREFPKLLKAALDPKMDRSDRAIILSQMRTLSRCDFEKRVLNQGDDIEAEHRAAVAKWEDWWSAYGSKLARSLPESGQRYEEAWKEVAPSPYLECPQYPISIPKSWSSTVSFRSGDYGGVTEEVIEFNVNERECELRRRYRTGRIGEADWTHEVWEDFSHEEAGHFLAALIYAIDNPWFFGDDKLSALDEKGERKIGHIRGRPRAWTNYYPSYEWSGILDADQRIIINHDPWNWDTINHNLGKKTGLDGGAFGMVFRHVRDSFPDPTWIPSKSRWKKIAPPKNREEQDGADPATAPESTPEGKENTKQESEVRSQWENVPAILVPSPPGATPAKQWRLQAVIDDTSLYLKFTYPEALPPVGKNLANSFEPTSESLNQLPFVKVLVPPESLSKYEERPKATLPDGTRIDFAQVGDPEAQFEIHAGFFLRSKAPDGRQRVTFGGGFDRKDLVQGYQSAVIGIQGYVKSLKQGGKRTDYQFEGGDEPSQFVIEESAFILMVPLAHGNGEDGKTLEPILGKPLPDLSLRVFPSGSNHFKPYIPKRISVKIEQGGGGSRVKCNARLEE